jgi:hypothetical protein
LVGQSEGECESVFEHRNPFQPATHKRIIDVLTPNTKYPSPQTTPPPVANPPRKKHRWLLWVFSTFFTLMLVIVASAALTLWWLQRPIKPLVLSTGEKDYRWRSSWSSCAAALKRKNDQMATPSQNPANCRTHNINPVQNASVDRQGNQWTAQREYGILRKHSL